MVPSALGRSDFRYLCSSALASFLLDDDFRLGVVSASKANCLMSFLSSSSYPFSHQDRRAAGVGVADAFPSSSPWLSAALPAVPLVATAAYVSVSLAA